ncbi:MAG: hypothetical protein GY849_16195, partial [Deltaproteobacteria bacterium]|nr:hypothetical protein [Deltaproteobacteria bacterium]
PLVLSIVPESDTEVNTTTAIEIGANITDNIEVDQAIVTLTLPNTTVLNITLNSSGDWYNTSYIIPDITGTYYVMFIVNDSSGLLNSTETTYFTAVRNSIIINTYVNGTHIIDSNATDSNFTFGNVSGSSANNTDAVNTSIANSTFVDVNSSNSNASVTVVISCTLNGTSIVGGGCNGSVIIGSTLNGTIVVVANVSGSNLTLVNVSGGNVGGTDAVNASFITSTVIGSNGSNVTVINSTVNNTNLVNLVVNATNISGGYCYSGEIVYEGVTYSCPIDIYSDLYARIVPVVSLISPVNDTFTSNSSLDFVFNATNTALRNATLYVWNLTGDLFGTNFTNITGIFNQTSLSLSNFSDGVYVWNVLVFDAGGNGAWAVSNFSFEVGGGDSSWDLIVMPEGVFEPFNVSLAGTHEDTFSVRFVNLSIVSSQVLSCFIRMSNGSFRNVNETGLSLIQQNYSLNYSVSNFDSIVDHVSVGYLPWVLKNCSIGESGVLVFDESTSGWNSTRVRRIYVHSGVVWDVSEITRAVACAGAPGKYFNNTAKCEYQEDTKFAIQMYADSPTEESCVNNPGVGNDSEYCRTLFFPTNDPLDYFGGMSALVDDPNGYSVFTSLFSGYSTDVGYSAFVNSSGNFKLRLVESVSGVKYSVTIYNLSNVSSVDVYGSELGGGVSGLSDNGDGTWNVFIDNLAGSEFTGILDFTFNVSFDEVLDEDRWLYIVIAYGEFSNQASPDYFVVNFSGVAGLRNNNESENTSWTVGFSEGGVCGDGVNNDFDYLGVGGIWDDSYDCFDSDCDGFAGSAVQSNEFGFGKAGLCNYVVELNCTDEYNNDYDSYTDCHDSNCFLNDSLGCPVTEQVCNDGSNDDWDYTTASTNVVNNGTKWSGSYQVNLTDCMDLDCNNSVGGQSGELCNWGYETNCSDGFDNDALQLYDCQLTSVSGNDAPTISNAEYDCRDYCRVTNTSAETGSMCDDGFDNDWDAVIVTGYNSGSANTSADAGIDCRWGNYFGYSGDYNPDEDCNNTILSNGKECQLAIERNCTDGFDNDYDHDASGMPRAGWSASSAAYLSYYGVAYSNDADFDDYDCASDAGAISDEAINASYCFDGVDNDLDAYYWGGSNWVVNSSTGKDCFDPDCLGVTNPDDENQTCLSYEYNASLPFFQNLVWPGQYCDNGLDDDADTAQDCADTDCYRQFDMCSQGPCFDMENKTWDSCFDGSDNDGGIGSDGTDCVDTDCDGMFASVTGALCEHDTEVSCDDGVDNNAESGTDCDDSDCYGLVGGLVNGTSVYCRVSESTPSDCSDGFDNDNDGDVDCYDSGCLGVGVCEGLFSVSGNALVSLPQYSGSITLSGIDSGTEARVEQSTDEVRVGEYYNITFRGLQSSSDIQWTIGTFGNPFNKSRFINSTVALSGSDAGSFNIVETAYGYRLDDDGLSGTHEVTFSIRSNGILSSFTYELIFYDGSNGLSSPGNNINYEVHENVSPVVSQVNISPVQGIIYGGDLQIIANASDNSAFGRCEFSVGGVESHLESAANCKIDFNPTTEGTYDVNVTPVDKYSNVGDVITKSYELNIRPVGISISTDTTFYSPADSIVVNSSFNVAGGDSLGSCRVYAENATGSALLGSFAATGSNCNGSVSAVGLTDGTYEIYVLVNETSEGDVVKSGSYGVFVCSQTLSGVCRFADFNDDSYADVC